MTRRKAVTAEEFLRELESTPGWKAKQTAQEAEVASRQAKMAKVEAPLLADLRRSGVDVRSIWELVNMPTVYENAFPVLIEHLQRTYPDEVLEGIARALASPKARSYLGLLVDLYMTRHNVGVKFADGLAVAIAAMAAKDDVPVLEALLRDRRCGESRIFFVPAMIRVGREVGWQVLESLAQDPHLSKEIAHRLASRAKRKKKR